jgi:CubicO group peptidase (beta-lactamase class C family)
LIVLAVTWVMLPKQNVTSTGAANFDDFIEALRVEVGIPGLVIGKISKGEVAFVTGYGLADIEQNKAVTTDTLFNIASISKPIMGLALLQLVDQGKLSLDTNINDYLSFTVDNPNFDNEVITLRHLATHTSGIADYYDINSYSENKDADISLTEHLKSLLTSTGAQYANGKHFLPHSPGEVRKYSNLAAALAGQLVQSVTGQTLAEYSQTHLFTPLGLKNTNWLLNDLDLSTVAVPYEVSQCIQYTSVCANTEEPQSNYVITTLFNPASEFISYQPYPHFGNPQYPDGGIRTSINDLSVLLSALLKNVDSNGNPLLSASMYQEMLKLQLPATLSTRQRFFWRDNNMSLAGHMGSDLGVFSAAYFDVDSKDGFIVLMNRGVDEKAGEAMKQIAVRVMGM